MISADKNIFYIREPPNVMEHPRDKFFRLVTFGCQMNQADAQRIRGIMQKSGFSETQDDNKAEVILFNTCCVRNHAEQRLISRVQALSPLKQEKKNLLIGIAGCMAQNRKENLFSLLPGIDLVFGPNDIESLPDLLNKALSAKTTGDFLVRGAFDGEKIDGIILDKPFSAFVNIIRGCTNFCSYCIVPFVRGPEISRPIHELIEFINDLSWKGVLEIILLGQNVNLYGKDIGLNEGFAQLLEAVEKIDGIKRVRFLTSHPRDFSPPSIDRISKLNKICEQFHIPAQSGSNRILSLMNRGYTRESYIETVKYIRNCIPDVCITTDLICGFPAETDEDFEQTLALVRELKFEAAYMYFFSPRDGTKAASFAGQIPEEIRKRRLATLIEVQNAISLEESQKYVGRTIEVLIESESTRIPGHLIGKSRTGRIVDFKADPNLLGKFATVKIDKARIWTLSGIMLSSSEG